MVAGIILVAFGMEQVLAHVGDHLHLVPAFALYAGTALYLLAHVALRLRNAHTVNWRSCSWRSGRRPSTWTPSSHSRP